MTTSRDPKGRFPPGVSGNPTGRNAGSRNKLGHAFIVALQADFEAHGEEAIKKVRADKPHEYLKVIASVLPKELHVKDTTLDEMTDGEILGLIADVRAAKAGSGGKSPDGDPETADDPGAIRH